jgi:hypothetical protein
LDHPLLYCKDRQIEKRAPPLSSFLGGRHTRDGNQYPGAANAGLTTRERPKVPSDAAARFCSRLATVREPRLASGAARPP